MQLLSFLVVFRTCDKKYFVATQLLHIFTQVSRDTIHTIQVTEQEKKLFSEWLIIKQRDLLEQLEMVKSLLGKINVTDNDTTIIQIAKEDLVINPNPKWAAKSLKILKEHRKRMDSTEVVDILMEKDPLSKQLPRVEVMRGVSSRLNQLVKQGRAKKEEINGKKYYTYIKD